MYAGHWLCYLYVRNQSLKERIEMHMQALILLLLCQKSVSEIQMNELYADDDTTLRSNAIGAINLLLYLTLVEECKAVKSIGYF